MGKMEQITVGVPTDLAQALSDAVAAGEFPSADEAIAGFISEWRAARENFGLSNEQMRQLLDAGVASGKGRFQTADAIIAEAHRRSAERRRAAE